MSSLEIGYWGCTAFACVCAVLPYSWVWLFGYRPDIVVIDFVSAGLWIVFFGATVYFANAIGRGRWWVALTAPFALFHAIEFILMLVFWKLFGFAP